MRINQSNIYYKNLRTSNYTTNNSFSNSLNVNFGNALANSLTKVVIKRKSSFSSLVEGTKRLLGYSSKGNFKSSFMSKLRHKYNRDNYYAEQKLRENPQLVNEIYNIVKKPQGMHSILIDELEVNLSELKKIFENAKSSKRLKFVLDFHNNILKKRLNVDDKVHKTIISDVLISPYSDEYIKHFEKYKSYFRMRKGKDSVVRDLDKMVSNNSFNRRFYDNLLKEEKAKRFFSRILNDSPLFNKEIYSKIRNPERDDILSFMAVRDNISVKDMETGIDKILLNIVTSTTKDNVSIRKRVVANCFGQNDASDKLSYYKKLLTVFSHIDKSEDAKMFIKKVYDSSLNIEDMSELIGILDNIPYKKLNMFFDNVLNIIKKTNKDNRIGVLKKEIENAVYTTPEYEKFIKEQGNEGFYKKDTKISKLVKYLFNEITKVRYNLTTKDVKKVEPVSVENIVVSVAKQTAQPKSKVDITVNPFVETERIKTPKSFAVRLSNSKKVADKPITPAMQRKLDIKENVLALVSKKLGSRTYADQRPAFDRYANKMRFNMLPEIFASIVDTRKADRLAGKKKSLSCNKDVVELFIKINGKNKKLVNYLLKKRNIDGTRMFEVNEIIEIINNAESQIKHNKLKPEGFSPKQTKAYYDQLFNEKVEQFGKVKRVSPVKKTLRKQKLSLSV